LLTLTQGNIMREIMRKRGEKEEALREAAESLSKRV
jgi:hypothetical protein